MRYRPELDGLRAPAACAVILTHANPYAGPLSGGYIGVDIFFVLSAFLITSLLSDELERAGSINLRRFYWRRFCRLMPALLFMLASYMTVAPLIWPGHDHGRDALLSALYASDYSQAFWNQPAYLVHTWSLSVEEHFYLLWPLAIPFVIRARRPVVLLLTLFVAATLWRYAWAWNFNLYYYRFDTRMSGLFLGAALALGLPMLRPSKWSARGAVVALLLCLLCSYRFAWAVGTIAELASAVLLAALLTGNAAEIGALLRGPLLVRLGKLSYAIYLWQYPFSRVIRDHLSYWPTVAATLVFSILMAWISYHTAEAIGRRLRDFRFTSPVVARSESGS